MGASTIVLPLAGRLTGVNLLATGIVALPLQLIQSIAAAAHPADLRFIAQFCYAYVRTMTGGALTTAPTIRLGTNAGHTNICPAFTPPTSIVVDTIGAVPLAAGIKGVNLASDVVSFEVLTAGVGPSAMTGDILLCGIVVKATDGWP